MQPTLALKETDPHDSFAIDPEAVVAARSEPPFFGPDLSPANDIRPVAPQDHPASAASATAPSLDAALRVAAIDNLKVPNRSPVSSWARRASFGFLLALGSGLAAEGWSRYGDVATALAQTWTPKLVAAFTPQQVTPVAATPSAPAPETAVADHATAQAATSAQPTPGNPPQLAAPPADSALLQSMAQQIEQLKASVEQLKSSQEQMARDMARNSEARAEVEPVVRPRPPAPPRPVAAVVRKPKPAYSSSMTPDPSLAPRPLQAQAAALPPPRPQPYPAPQSYQLPPPPGDDSVVRPPMPMR
jgi:hypothetical protein